MVTTIVHNDNGTVIIISQYCIIYLITPNKRLFTISSIAKVVPICPIYVSYDNNNKDNIYKLILITT
jgi:hypothetical protein